MNRDVKWRNHEASGKQIVDFPAGRWGKTLRHTAPGPAGKLLLWEGGVDWWSDRELFACPFDVLQELSTDRKRQKLVIFFVAVLGKIKKIMLESTRLSLWGAV